MYDKIGFGLDQNCRKEGVFTLCLYLGYGGVCEVWAWIRV